MGQSPLWPGWDGVAAGAPVSALDVGGGGGGTAAGSVDALDPCDLDAEAVSFWAAQNVAADVLTKHRWLSCTSTEERLRDVRGVCEVIMARYRDRGGGEGGLVKPLSAPHDILSK